MNNVEKWSAKMDQLTEKIQPVLSSVGMFFCKVWDVLSFIGEWIWKLRKVIMAIPVVWLSIYFARLNSNVLPDSVGLNLLVNGEYAKMIPKALAVYGPLAVTGACLLMMMMSKKTLYPWLVCLFTLAFPLLLLLTNVFPA